MSFTDASFNTISHQVYGQTCSTSGIGYLEPSHYSRNNGVIDCTSRKQRRVCYSAYGDDILACSTAEDRGFAIKQVLVGLISTLHCVQQVRTDSKTLFDLVTTLHVGKENRLRQTVQQIRDAFESKELNQVLWIRNHANIAESLT